MFQPAAPGFKIQWIDEHEVIQEQKDLVGWEADESGDQWPCCWEPAGGFMRVVKPDDTFDIDVVAR